MRNDSATVLLALTACGRIGFDPGGDLTVDGAAPCTGTWSSPMLLPAQLQSNVDDWGPAPGDHDNELVWFSYRDLTGDSDVFSSRRATPNDAWSAPARIAAAFDAGRNAEPDLTEDGLLLVWDNIDAGGEPYLVFSKRASTSDAWGNANDFDELDTADGEMGVGISDDGLRMVFTYHHAGGIYETTRATRDDLFGPPVSVFPTPSVTDFYPALSHDALDLYFSSTGRGGAGGYDLFVAHRDSLAAPFGAPTAIAELSSSQDDVDAQISSDGTTMYFNYSTSDAGGANAEMYFATRSCD